MNETIKYGLLYPKIRSKADAITEATNDFIITDAAPILMIILPLNITNSCNSSKFERKKSCL